MPQQLTDGLAARSLVRSWQRQGEAVALVPTMGALHEGHLSLVRHASRQCPRTVVSVFVNPTQFGPNEDFEQYPRQLEADLELLEALGVDAVFTPSTSQMYPPGHSTFVEPPAVAKPWEGAFRPGHFRGVATVVLKLFHLLPADLALFGQKDYQQCRVIQDMVRDLDLPIRIAVCPTQREPDGLAMSSRNVYLSPGERAQAVGLYHALIKAGQLYRDGQSQREVLELAMHEELQQHGIDQIDYAVVVDGASLEPQPRAHDRSVALIAARVGRTRLIDNMRLLEGA